ncbi:DUF4167 domain-containing protein [Ferruginivarius sediminum]|uniref:DUF4167 domain-containing protein n=1 Tax=Ferruginivarius sediminum TaxID=2661937 RepID=A0A369T7X6_9PROT|nr:DUF4167 domain-containing protein [Ferruginivarius sediminum]RDD60992.1 DUF4167 domain-containing protein [Ferruginivarius sediminum]
MRQGASGRRTRGRSGGRKNVPLKMQNFDSNGPDVRVRGNANQVYDKYLALARDATMAGDRVVAESYYQHAEHYYRIINETTDPQSEDRSRQNQVSQGEQEDAAGAPNGADRQQRGGGRGTRQERRERHEQAEGRGPREPQAGAEPAQQTDDGGEKPDEHHRPDGYGRVESAKPDGPVGNGKADPAPAPQGRAGDSVDAGQQGDLLSRGDAQPTAGKQPEPVADAGEAPAEAEEKPKRGRGRPRKTATSTTKGTGATKSAGTRTRKSAASKAAKGNGEDGDAKTQSKDDGQSGDAGESGGGSEDSDQANA